MNVIQTILDYNKSKESGGKTDITKSDIISALGYTPISELEKGANSGIAELDDNGKVLTSELPSYVDDVEEFNNLVELQKHTGEASKIYITLDDNKCYRWGGTAYVEISSSITLGETSGTAFRGDLGKEAYDKSHTHSNKEVIDSITSEDITNWNNKSDFDGKYTSLTDTPTIPTVTNDLTNELKANYDLAYTQTHTHSNKELLDKLSLNKDNKLLYNGDKVDSDVDLTAIIDDSTIADKTTWSSNKINTTIPKTWVGTKADYEQIKDTLENGTIVYIIDDESVILLDKTEITKMKLTDEEFKRQINTLYDINNGSTLSIETDSETAYQKAVPTGAKLMSVKNIGGKSLVWNQLYYVYGGRINCKPIFKSHKYLLRVDYSVSENTKVYLYFRDAKYTAGTNRQITKDIAAGSGKISWITSPLGEHSDGGEFGAFIVVNNADGSEKYDTSPFSNHEIFDLTAMFGTGNEPSTVEEFEKIFPADYYPYNAGEIVSAGTEEIVEQGANLYYGTDMLKCGSDDYEYLANSYRCKSIKLKPNTTYTLGFTSDKTSEIIILMNVNANVNVPPYFDFRKASHTQTYTTGDDGCLYVGVYVGNGSVASTDVINRLSECEIMISEGDTPTAYAPYHRNVYPIPEAIRALPGYGVEGNTVDYETKTYTQNNAVDGTAIKALDTPIVTDISNLIPDDFLRNLTVEAGGSITFKNSNGDSYRIPVPSELSYTVKFNSNASKEYVDSELAKKANNTDITNTLSSYAKKTDIPTKLPANGGNADTVNNHTVLSDVPTDAKFTDTITSIEDSSTTSTTSTWSAQKINDTITNSKNARVILSTDRNVEEAETKTAELVSLDGAYLYWSSQAGANNYVFGIILYVYNKWIMIPIAQSSEDASTGVSFSITDNTITMTRHNTGSTPTAGGVFALGSTLI